MVSINEKNIDIINLHKYIKKYELKYKDEYKEYSIQNIRIISDRDNIDFFKKVIIDDNYKLVKCLSFSFYKVDNETKYRLYTNNNILLKLYKNTFDIEKIIDIK